MSWTQWDYSELSFNNDDHVYIAGDNPGGFSHSFNDYSHFSVSGDRFSVTGSVMSLLDKDQALLVIPSENCFCRLFQSCTNLTHAPTLPATTLTTACYYQMFDGCSALYRAPEELPATVLAQECYYSMFSHCTSLDQDPFILATEVADYCCYNMFYGCTSLTAAQFLMAETLAPWCYGQMYAGCTNLESTSTLPAQTLVNGCYYHMFSNCEKLAYVECLATDISAEEATTTWLEGVASTGTFMKAPNAQWPTGYNGIPEGWTVQSVKP